MKQMEVGFEMSKEVHPFCERVTDEGDSFTLDELQWNRARGQLWAILGKGSGWQGQAQQG
jgi:hypothetical protein